MPFAVIAGVMAFLIQYEEMRHHLDRRGALRAGAEAGIVAAVALALLSLAAARLLGLH